jgi:hypothetical protein
MLSARQPDDVLRRSGKAGCDVEILILIVLSILAVWISSTSTPALNRQAPPPIHLPRSTSAAHFPHRRDGRFSALGVAPRQIERGTTTDR